MVEPSNETPENQKDTLSVQDWLIRIFFHSVSAAVVYFAGRFSWWLGFVLFIGFFFYVLVEVIFYGVVVFTQALLGFLMAKRIRTRGVKLDRLDELKQPLGSLLKMNIVLAAFDIYILSLTIALAGFFFVGWFR